MKIRTNLKGTWGSSVNTADATIAFSEEGIAEVADEIGLSLIENFPNHYYEDGGEDPELVAHRERILAANKGKDVGPSEESKVKVATFDSTIVNDVVEAASGAGGGAPENTDVVDVVDDPESGSDEGSDELIDQLKELKHGQIKAMLIEAGVPEDDLKQYKSRDAIYDFAIETLNK